ncbi:MAG: DUF983 domain-containing protein [Bacteroidota bacterium]|nr:DUF983 domain-containing protein [Bacteroidota bacterium]
MKSTRALTGTGAFVQGRCPRCRQGKVFVFPAYNWRFQVMYERCPACDLKYEIETGFFWGSMYISYVLTVLIGLPLIIATYHLLHDPEVWVYLTILVIVLLITSPSMFRISRLIMLYLFGSIKYDPNAVGNLRDQNYKA